MYELKKIFKEQKKFSLIHGIMSHSPVRPTLVTDKIDSIKKRATSNFELPPVFQDAKPLCNCYRKIPLFIQIRAGITR